MSSGGSLPPTLPRPASVKCRQLHSDHMQLSERVMLSTRSETVYCLVCLISREMLLSTAVVPIQGISLGGISLFCGELQL